MRDGIYFNLSEADYLAEDRLSKSGIKKLRISPADYWADSPMNTARKERDTAALIAGRAYHCARLEPDRFRRVYVRELSKAEMPPGTLFTGTEMGATLAEMGEKKTGSVAEQAARLAEAGFDPAKVWHCALAEWAAAIQPGQIAISAELYDEITADMARIRSVPAINALLSDGAAEVSVFWTCQETGIPMKARFDYLKPDRWVEVKTFANPNGKNLSQCITDAIRFNRYYIDAAAYMEAAEAIRSGCVGIMDEATASERELIEEIQLRADPLECNFVFQQKGGVPNILERSWRFFEPTPSDEAIRELERDGATEERLERARRVKEVAKSARRRTVIHTKGRMEIAAAKRDFLAYSEIYERGEPWLPFNPSGEITDDDFSQYFLEEAI
jgi:hypothetical protein